MTATTRDQIAFARFCIEHNVSPADAAELGRLANRAFKAGERHCNDGTEKSHKLELSRAAEFKAAAAKLGFETEWYGLWPTLRKDGRDVGIPM